MQNLSPDEEHYLQNELADGESLLWSGKPNPRVIFHPSDWYMIPFSLLWGGFAIFWEAGVTGSFGFSDGHSAPPFFMLWGIPFVIIGQYFIWGRFFYAAWKKTRILYAITNRRVLVIALRPWPKTISAFIDNIPVIDKEVRSDGIGTLKFGNINNSPWSGSRRNTGTMDGLYLNSGIPVFVDVDDVASVVAIVTGQRERVSRQYQQQ
jgi:hypothetical protein